MHVKKRLYLIEPFQGEELCNEASISFQHGMSTERLPQFRVSWKSLVEIRTVST